jgi:hypothetical protein
MEFENKGKLICISKIGFVVNFLAVFGLGVIAGFMHMNDTFAIKVIAIAYVTGFTTNCAMYIWLSSKFKVGIEQDYLSHFRRWIFINIGIDAITVFLFMLSYILQSNDAKMIYLLFFSLNIATLIYVVSNLKLKQGISQSDDSALSDV